MVLSLEGLYICINLTAKKEKEQKIDDRRKIVGEFKNPLGDTYRKNTKGHLVPIRPHSKMIDGSDEKDEV